MCWSLEVSVLTGSACFVTAAYLIQRNKRWDRVNALHLMAVSSMQFLDAILWWDGMEGCSTTNWVTSVLGTPLVLCLQMWLRMMDVRFTTLPQSLLWVAVTVTMGLVAVSTTSTWSPVQMFLYAANMFRSFVYANDQACSRPDDIDVGSPLWGGYMPIFGGIFYTCFALPPVFKTGRYTECAFHVSTLSLILFFHHAWATKWCSFVCCIAVLYLFWSGPALPPHAHAHLKEANAPVRGPVTRVLHAYERFCFGTAKRDD